MPDRPSSTPLMEAGDEKRSTTAMMRLTHSADTPAVIRVVRRCGFAHHFETEHQRRNSVQPFRLLEWAMVEGPPFDRSGEACINIRYADGAKRVLPINHYIWESEGMNRARLAYIDKREDD